MRVPGVTGAGVGGGARFPHDTRTVGGGQGGVRGVSESSRGRLGRSRGSSRGQGAEGVPLYRTSRAVGDSDGFDALKTALELVRVEERVNQGQW